MLSEFLIGCVSRSPELEAEAQPNLRQSQNPLTCSSGGQLHPLLQ
jgi:hypothetical protein